MMNYSFLEKWYIHVHVSLIWYIFQVVYFLDGEWSDELYNEKRQQQWSRFQ